MKSFKGIARVIFTFWLGLGLARLAADGTPAGSNQMIARVPSQVYLESPVAARRGPDIVVAWKKSFMLKGISIARLTP